MRYSLFLLAAEPEPGQLSDEIMAAGQAAFRKYAQDLHAAGVLVAADILQPSASTTQLTLRAGKVAIQDGPFATTKEQLAGVFIIEVPDLDAALAWAEACPGAHYGTVEVRPCAVTVRDGVWLRPQ